MSGFDQTGVCWVFEFADLMFVHYAKFRLIAAPIGFFFPHEVEQELVYKH